MPSRHKQVALASPDTYTLDNSRICIREEDKAYNTLGYNWLKEDEIPPFYELRMQLRIYVEKRSLM
jgi:hypothetical protein